MRCSPSPRAVDARRLAGLFFVLQGAAAVLWWAALALRPGWAPVFFAPALRPALPLFLLNDALIYGMVGGLAGWRLLAQDRRHGVWLAVLASAGILVATVPTVAATVQEGVGRAGALAMGASALATCAVTAWTYFMQAAKEGEFHPADEARGLLWRSFRQTTLLWILALLVWPALIAACEKGLDWPVIAPRPVVGAVVFVACGGLGLWATATMARIGRGTPLPGDCAPVLVVTGPYALVRNPMAVAGIGQAAAVGVGIGSPMVLLYAALGAAAWHFGARPREEADLRRRFGAAFEAYRRRVGLWVPKRGCGDAVRRAC